mmetsp:Transcript_17451/g.49900  ORF Transcript_17451/g.49900 Transcript_17451/m.49900 type:complete len:140 (-) Transcript_17451:26-445(-)
MGSHKVSFFMSLAWVMTRTRSILLVSAALDKLRTTRLFHPSFSKAVSLDSTGSTSFELHLARNQSKVHKLATVLPPSKRSAGNVCWLSRRVGSCSKTDSESQPGAAAATLGLCRDERPSSKILALAARRIRRCNISFFW